MTRRAVLQYGLVEYLVLSVKCFYTLFIFNLGNVCIYIMCASIFGHVSAVSLSGDEVHAGWGLREEGLWSMARTSSKGRI